MDASTSYWVRWWIICENHGWDTEDSPGDHELTQEEEDALYQRWLLTEEGQMWG